MPAADHELDPDRVDVWVVRLGAPPRRAESLLSPDERRRLARFRVPSAHARFLEVRSRLRLLLGRYLDADPGELRFAYGEHGKPSVAGEPRLRFNLSHSGELALIAVGCQRELGVDVEEMRPGRRFEGMARRRFHAPEYERIMALPPHGLPAAFYAIWSSKEALIKADGRGLAALSQFEVAPWGDEPLVVVGAASERWWLKMLDVGDPAYAAAVASERPAPPRVRVRRQR